MSAYSTGSVTITAGKTTVVGSGTAFTKNVEAGDLFKLRGQAGIYDIAAVNSATKVTLTARYSSADYQTNRTNEHIATTNATDLTYIATIANTPIIQETLVVTGSDETWTDDDGSGTLTAAASPSGSSGTIDYDTGALSITYSASPTEDYGVTAIYQSGDEANSVSYQIVTDFTTNYEFPEMSINDVNFQHIYTKAMRLIDAALGTYSYSSTMTGNETFTDPQRQIGTYFLDPNGANRNFDPSGTFTAGLVILIKNIGTDYNIIFDSENSIQIIRPTELAIMLYDGSQWR